MGDSQQIYQEVELSKIVPCPVNPRKTIEGPRFDELVDSIRQVGVIEPIIVRNAKKGRKKVFEIVAGERRFRAACVVAKENGGLKGAAIPALVRDLDDDQAFDFMVVENLVRADLTEYEEAQSFKTYLDKHSKTEEERKEALVNLAERTGINPRYIRRRAAVLSLPTEVLEAWDKGELKYGHLEQFLRLTDTPERISSDQGEPQESYETRVARKKYLQQKIRQALNDRPDDDLVIRKLVLFNLIALNLEIHTWFAKRHNKVEQDHQGYFDFEEEEVIEVINMIDPGKIPDEIKAVAIECIASDEVPTFVGVVAEKLLGIDPPRPEELEAFQEALASEDEEDNTSAAEAA